MPSPGLIKQYTAGAAITACRIVKMGAADYAVLTAAAAADIPVGISQEKIDAASGDRIDVIESGEAKVSAGGTIARGARVTSNATGQAVAAATGNQSIGTAKVSAVSGDLFDVIIDRSPA